MSALLEGGYQVLAKLGLATTGKVDKPASGATITLWSSTTNGTKGAGRHYKGVYINIFSSHASAANGLTVEESSDEGTTWDAVATGTSISATTYTKTYVKVSAPEVRVRYANSASVVTTWRGSVMGDLMERSNG